MTVSTETELSTSSVSETCTLLGTVVTGFEDTALSECKDKFPVSRSFTEQGKVIFTIPCHHVSAAVNSLRSIDNLYVVGCKLDCPELVSVEKENCEKTIKKFVGQVNWRQMIGIWNDFKSFSDSIDTITSQVSTKLKDTIEDNVKFRVSCHRTGTKHSFTSTDVASWFGGQINDTYGWRVDLTKFDLDVVLWINDSKVYVMTSLNESSLHKRNIKYFGPTTLRPTICYNMIRYGGVKLGEIVCDPMCGSGSIPIESAISFPTTFNIGGDNHELAYKRTWRNVHRQNVALNNINSFAWDVRCLPLRDNSVDVFVTDFPFGKRSGSTFNNRKLYPAALKEMARVCHNEKGRAVLLTQDVRSLNAALKTLQSLWYAKDSRYINIGGLWGKVCLLTRFLAKK